MAMFLTNDLAERFMIKGVLKMPFKFLGSDVWITDSMLTLIMVVLVLLIFGFVVNAKFKKAAEVPVGFQNVMELIVEKLDGMSRGNFGENASRFCNYFGCIFMLIIVCNLMGLLGLRTPTGDFGVTLPLGLFTFFIIQYQSIKNAGGFGTIKALFEPIPVLFPINLIGEIANPITLALRLFANMLSGIIIMGLWYGMIPLLGKLGLPAFLHVYCDLFSGCIQAYVFCMLSEVYVSGKL